MRPRICASNAAWLVVVINFGLLATICSGENSCARNDNVSPKKSIFYGRDVDVKVITVASDETEGYQRFIRSAQYYNIDVTTLGLGEKWEGGDMNSFGGGYKVNLLKEAVLPYKDNKDTLILFTDSYDVLFANTLDVIVHKFKKTGAKILFGAEHYCWPDQTVEHIYPEVAKHLPRFLNSGLFIGYAAEINEVLAAPIKNKDDDQLYYTKVFLDEEQCNKLGIKLDYRSEIFQNLNGATANLRLDYSEATGEYIVKNIVTESLPSVLHGNGPNKVLLNNFGNYIAGAFKHQECQLCVENLLPEFTDPEKLPTVTLGVFVEKATPFLEEFFESVAALEYPKKKISLFVHNNIQYHHELVNSFVETYGPEYANSKQILYSDKTPEPTARNLAVSYAERQDTDYLFVVDADVHIDDGHILIDLIRQNKNVIAPLLTRSGESWSNYWGALSEMGFYARSHDYMNIVKNTVRGIWNVPFISSCYLVKKDIFARITYADDTLDADMAFCKVLRRQQIFLHVFNQKTYGHLINIEEFNTALKHPDFYMLKTNQKNWEDRYIHRDYYTQLQANATHKQPCTDVYWFAIGTERFCKELIDIVENFGKWSDGTNSDERLQGGYEAVPTRDIHMNQVGLEAVWLHFLFLYVRPLQEAVYDGYYHNPPRSLMNFVVRYRPDEQPALRPHHDSSTYTINIALNQVGVDYEGGGCRFLRYNCSVQSTQVGWMLMHPGRLTHFHEGLRTTKGTRYIMISFVDP